MCILHSLTLVFFGIQRGNYIKECREKLGSVPVMCWRGLCNGAYRGNNIQMMSRAVVDVVLDLKLPDDETLIGFNSVISRCQYLGNAKDASDVVMKEILVLFSNVSL
jgi:hypothetical protein